MARTRDTRIRFTVEQIFYAIRLKKAGLSARANGTAFKERYGFRPTPSTMSTFYNRRNMERYGQRTVGQNEGSGEIGFCLVIDTII